MVWFVITYFLCLVLFSSFVLLLDVDVDVEVVMLEFVLFELIVLVSVFSYL